MGNDKLSIRIPEDLKAALADKAWEKRMSTTELTIKYITEGLKNEKEN